MGKDRPETYVSASVAKGSAALDRELAVLRAAERLGQFALRWLPYPDEVPEERRAERDGDQSLMENDLNLIRRRLKTVEHEVLVAAQERGEASV